MDKKPALDIVRLSQDDPIWYIRNVLGETPWSIQRRIVESVRVNKRTAVKSAHGVGKSFIAARTAVWFLQNFENSVVLTTAPSFNQVNDILWKEIRLAWGRANKGVLAGRLFAGQPRLEVDKTWFCHGFATDDPDNFQGTHAPHVLIIFDEACGISPAIWNALDGNLTSDHCRFLAIGNPTDPANPFFNECASDATQVFTISAFDSPNFTELGITESDMLDGSWQQKVRESLPFPGLVGPEWVSEALAKHGRGSGWYQSRVLGEFPQQSTDALIHMSWVDHARSLRLPHGANVTQVSVGVDVARYGDDETVISAFAWWDDLAYQVLIRGTTQEDTQQSADRTLSAAMELHRQFPHASIDVRIDADGLGAGVFDAVRRAMEADARLPEPRLRWLSVYEVHNGAKARHPESFINARAEMWWATRNLFEDGRVGIMNDPLQETQLVGITFRHTPGRDQVQIERKDEMKKRGLKSPDRGDALMMALAVTKKPVPHVAAPIMTRTNPFYEMSGMSSQLHGSGSRGGAGLGQYWDDDAFREPQHHDYGPEVGKRLAEFNRDRN
jgi:hypothetical protein